MFIQSIVCDKFNNFNSLSVRKVKPQSFCGAIADTLGQSDVYSPSNAVSKFLREAKISKKDLGKNILNWIKPENLIGSGITSNVYSIPQVPNYVLRTYKKYNPTSDKEKTINAMFYSVTDDFSGRNFGQPILENEYIYDTDFRLQILRKADGIPLYYKNWILHILDNQCNDKCKNDYMRQLAEIDSLDKRIFEKYIKDILFVQNRFYSVDFVNPNNILYDKRLKRFNIIDLGKVDNLPENNFEKWVEPLIDNQLLFRYFELMTPDERQIAIQRILNIYHKMKDVADSMGINTGNTKFQLLEHGYLSNKIDYSKNQILDFAFTP